MGLLDKLKRLRFPSLERGNYARESERPIDNTDALTATGGRGLDATGGVSHAQFPPDYVKQDDGRPLH
jgi:hypothetical protein